MNERKTFSAQKGQLRLVLKELLPVVSEQDTDDIIALEKKLIENRFHVTVVGEFKRGKSTLINALLGASVLPTGVVPLTSIPTTVAYGERARAVVRYADGREEDVGVEDLESYITERGNPRNAKGVDGADVALPASLLREGVRIVDTPGVGSVFEHNTEVAYASIPSSDASIFVVSADQPMSAKELRLLHDLRPYAERIFFVQNKIDNLSEAERDDSLAFTVSALEDALDTSVRVYPISAKLAREAKECRDHGLLIDSGFADFEGDFERFLVDGKGRALLASVASNALSICFREQNALDLAERTATMSIEELTRRMAAFDDAAGRLMQEHEDALVLFERDTAAILARFDNEISLVRDHEVPQLLAAIDEEIGSLRERGSRGLVSHLEDLLRTRIREIFDPWKAEAQEEVTRALQATLGKHGTKASELITELVQLAGDIFDLDLRSEGVIEGLEGSTTFTYRLVEVGTLLDSFTESINRLLPTRIAKGRIVAAAKARAVEVFDKHCGRLRGDLAQRLRETARVFGGRTRWRIEATRDALRIAAERGAQLRNLGADALARDTEQMAEQRQRLNAMIGQLAGIRDAARSSA